MGLTDEQRAGGLADLDVVQRWLDDGIAPNGARGRRFAAGDNHGVDLTFCAPKSLSLVRAYGADVMQRPSSTRTTRGARGPGIRPSTRRLHPCAQHHQRQKDLQRLPGLVAVAYHHETSRAGDPHLHTHVILPNKQARVDGTLAAVDTDSLWHESKAGGVIYQATMRREMAQSVGAEWGPVDPHTGMAELVGVDPAVIKAHSQRSTQLREWADCNLELIDGQPTPAQLAAAQKPPGRASRKACPGVNYDANGTVIRAVFASIPRPNDKPAVSAAQRRPPSAPYRRDRRRHRQARVHPRRPGGNHRRATTDRGRRR
ncbi:hypothetical protein NIIDMKKI_58450 [Mycobacterium kansasii]|uniref:TrwC relaxase domain-containing protein n=1 Tax=Mycobacterium kansasii TaxID=1768 RepID=A0A7G1ILB8_MYCKA|nr:hypothetical protein NIIDMKKI_58450 [Mycobacterium kansasii]